MRGIPTRQAVLASTGWSANECSLFFEGPVRIILVQLLAYLALADYQVADALAAMLASAQEGNLIF